MLIMWTALKGPKNLRLTCQLISIHLIGSCAFISSFTSHLMLSLEIVFYKICLLSVTELCTASQMINTKLRNKQNIFFFPKEQFLFPVKCVWSTFALPAVMFSHASSHSFWVEKDQGHRLFIPTEGCIQARLSHGNLHTWLFLPICCVNEHYRNDKHTHTAGYYQAITALVVPIGLQLVWRPAPRG